MPQTHAAHEDAAGDATLLAAFPEPIQPGVSAARPSAPPALGARLRAAFMTHRIAPSAILRFALAVLGGLAMAHLQNVHAPRIPLTVLLGVAATILVSGIVRRIRPRTAAQLHAMFIVSTLTAWVITDSIGPVLYIGLEIGRAHV